MRLIAGLNKTCPVDFLHLETNLEPINLRLEKLDDIIWDRYARLPETDSRRQLLDQHVPPRLKTRTGWRTETAKRMGNLVMCRGIGTPPLEPWLLLSHVSVEHVTLEKKKEEYSGGGAP
jgi:hypothetical protein